MKHLFFYLSRFKKILENKAVSLFLDYDGTLTPIAKTPDKAVIPQKTKAILKHLSKNRHCSVAIISGRALKDVKNKVGLKDIVYAGNHGLEIEGPGIRFKIPVSLRYKTALKRIKVILKKRLSKIKGIIVEDKGLTLSVHYRLMDKKDERRLKAIFHEALNFYIAGNKVKIKSGKKVLEIRPPLEWDKGEIVLWLIARRKNFLHKKNSIFIYIGDDITDEDAFMALKDVGMTVFVGNSRNSSAKYYLRDTGEVNKFLGQILKIKTDEDLCQN